MFDPVSLAVTAAGVGLSLFGESEKQGAAKKQANKEYKAAKKQSKLAQQAAAQQNAFIERQNTIIKEDIMPALKQQGEFLKAAADASNQAESLRERQMNLDAMRARRDIIRNMVLARSQSIVAASGQGASLKSSSVFGSLAQITSDAGRNTVGVNQNEQIGSGIFAANRAYTSAMSSANLISTKINKWESEIQTVANRAAQARNNAQNTISAAGIVKGSTNQGAFYSALGSSVLQAAPELTALGKSAIFGSSQPWYTTTTPSPGGAFDSMVGSSGFMDNAGNIYGSV